MYIRKPPASVMKAALLTGIRQFEIGQVLEPKIVRDTDVFIWIKTMGES
jgi:hypothetical protein